MLTGAMAPCRRGQKGRPVRTLWLGLIGLGMGVPACASSDKPDTSAAPTSGVSTTPSSGTAAGGASSGATSTHGAPIGSTAVSGASGGNTTVSGASGGSTSSGGGSASGALPGSDGGASNGLMADAAPDGTVASLAPINLSTAMIYSVFPPIYSQAGTLAAVAADLPRIHDLGFNVLYLLPVTPLGQPIGAHPAFGSPYCVHDYEAVNPALGTQADLAALVRSAHALGMHVMLDEVLNHTSWDNALITQHPEYYLHNDGNPQNVSSIEEAFTFADVAQLDYKTPANGLAAYMADMLGMWVNTYDVDGFRFDTADSPYGAARMIPATFWQGLRTNLEALKPGIVMLGEEEDPDLADAPFELD